LKPSSIRENIWTVPNILTFTRLISAPIIGYLVVNERPVLALSLFTYSCVTDYVDGFIARKYKMQTVLGSVIDPMADKALMITLTCCLAQSGDMPLYLATLILGRDLLLGFSALYYRYISLPLPKTFGRFWDFGIPSAEVHPTTISKYNTALQMLYIGLAMVNPVLSQSIEPAAYETFAISMNYYGYLVGTTTVLSGLSYVFSSKAVKIL
ncbi:CDP-diacylglycerol--glycerol-3-phosphate 3-phosphatidyltransferase, partial [Nadsonia fulvescens var. elongata DSM 6958]